MFKFLHSADLHLDSALRGLERYEGAPVDQLRGATRRAFENLVDLAIDEAVAFVLLAGDLYDGTWRDYNTGLFFMHQMSRLQEAGIRAFVVYGNHDAESRMTKQLRLPDNVHRFRPRQPETYADDDLGVAVHGQSFHRPDEESDLSARYPDFRPGWFNIGMLHTAAEGREGHARYAPTTVDYLANKGYDYWALGHVHKREILRQEPWIVFPGNIQGRHIRETGAKGCTLVTVDNGRVLRVEHRDLDVLRWARCTVNADGARTGADVVDRVARAVEDALAASQGRPTAMRLVVSGACQAHGDMASARDRWQGEIRAAATAASSSEAWIEKIVLETRSGASVAELADLINRDDALSGLMRSIQEMRAGEAQVAEMMALFTELQAKLPQDLRAGEDALDLRQPATVQAAVEDAKEILISRLLGTGGA